MATRGTVKASQQYGDERLPIMSLYIHNDSYPSGVGLELAQFLQSYTIVNGLGLGDYDTKKANGAGCLMAQYIAHIKDGPGNVYLAPIDQQEEFNYYVHFKGVTIALITVTDWNDDALFSGNLEEFAEWCVAYDSIKEADTF